MKYSMMECLMEVARPVEMIILSVPVLSLRHSSRSPKPARS